MDRFEVLKRKNLSSRSVGFVYITADAYTRDELVEMEIRMLVALEFRISTPTAAHFLELVGRVSRCNTRQQNLAQFLIVLTYRLFYERTLAITSCVLGCDHFRLSPRSGAGAKMATASNFWVRRRPHTERSGQFRLSQVLSCHFTMSLSPLVRTRVGSGEAVSLPVDWCAWENIPTRD